MPSVLHRPLAIVLAALLLVQAAVLPASATCGGGGGGGRGGAMGGGGSSTPQVYHVSWKVIGRGEGIPSGELEVLWFPTSVDNARASDLLTSRYLALSSAQCITMALISTDNATIRSKYSAPEAEPLVVLAGKDGSEVGRVPAEGVQVRVDAVEKLLRQTMDAREEAAKATLDAAKEKSDAKDIDGAAALYTQVWDQRCLLPSPAKKAAKALKKLGRPVAEEESSRLDRNGPDLSDPHSEQMVRTMRAGLAAEWQGKVLEAQRLYAAARRMDPNDPVPAVFYGELLRHETGDWAGARAVFEQVLAMSADPMSRAVALHGLGKMSIHDGRFQKGLALFQQSIDAWPLPLTYRNLAVYWNSEGQFDRAYGYVKKALELDPDDEYNQIFAATYLVRLGRAEEAEAIARRHEDLVAASYNLAAIYAQLGNKDKALAMLQRHFYVYEQFAAVRAKEMQEARDDIAFARYHQDPDFVKLTALADADASSYHRDPS
jgi:tetratricopeptide (TPR) repeat protein